MHRKITAAILIFANVLSLASCTAVKKPEETTVPDVSEEEDHRSYSEEKVYESIENIAASLAACDFDDLSKWCSGTPYELRDLMPVIEEEEDDDTYHSRSDEENMHLIKNMIASTITYEIDESTFKSFFLEKRYTVDVRFSLKDYKKVSKMRGKFLGAADFNTLMAEEESMIDSVLTLEFVKRDKHYLLSNPEVLAGLYDYDLPELEFMRNHFDMIEDSYMTGPGWDPYTESYYDTNTFEFVVELDANAPNYIWKYVYLISEETEPEWTRIYLSDSIIDKYPTGIHLTYTQEENFSTGYYCFIIYDYQSEDIYGWEFNVYNSADTLSSSSTVTGTVTDVTGETEESH